MYPCIVFQIKTIYLFIYFGHNCSGCIYHIFFLHDGAHNASFFVFLRYGPVWISTTLVFMLAALGNCGTYLMNRKSVPDTAWVFDVNYVNWAASVVYGYALLVPVAFYFLLQYFGCSASLTRFWCLWGYSLFIFIPSSVSIQLLLCYLFHCTYTNFCPSYLFCT